MNPFVKLCDALTHLTYRLSTKLWKALKKEGVEYNPSDYERHFIETFLCLIEILELEACIDPGIDNIDDMVVRELQEINKHIYSNHVKGDVTDEMLDHAVKIYINKLITPTKQS